MAERPVRPSQPDTRGAGGVTYGRSYDPITVESIRYIGDCIRYLADVLAQRDEGGQ